MLPTTNIDVERQRGTDNARRRIVRNNPMMHRAGAYTNEPVVPPEFRTSAGKKSKKRYSRYSTNSKLAVCVGVTSLIALLFVVTVLLAGKLGGHAKMTVADRRAEQGYMASDPGLERMEDGGSNGMRYGKDHFYGQVDYAMDGSEISMSDFMGDVLLLVNVASR